MHVDALAYLRCPKTGSTLRPLAAMDAAELTAGTLVAADGTSYPVRDGIPDFIDRGALNDDERRTMAEYDRVADGIYDVAVDWQFAAMHEDEDRVREAMVDQLQLTAGMTVLEIGCGTGRDSFRLARRLDARGRLHMQDLSPAMVTVCARRMADAGVECALDYSVSSALALPFADDTFDAVFHFGGFNQFGDLARGAMEMTRVAKPGGRILFGDEAVAPWLKGTEFDGIVTANNPLFKEETPLAALPVHARDVTVRWIIGNCFYVIDFRKGDGPPPLDLDLPHRGWRGGTMRSRYFGVLEGVTPEAKALAREAAQHAGTSVHAWLDALVREGARREREKPRS
jgi:ubiquinone/menaquinone biosynthesis C-methylase UbiE